jgi:hypothetical protein
MSAERMSALRLRAWQVHARRGHPGEYVGPCWGPTFADIEQAEAELAAEAVQEITPAEPPRRPLPPIDTSLKRYGQVTRKGSSNEQGR